MYWSFDMKIYSIWTNLCARVSQYSDPLVIPLLCWNGDYSLCTAFSHPRNCSNKSNAMQYKRQQLKIHESPTIACQLSFTILCCYKWSFSKMVLLTRMTFDCDRFTPMMCSTQRRGIHRISMFHDRWGHPSMHSFVADSDSLSVYNFFRTPREKSNSNSL